MASGKGGTGKTTVATSLALALAKRIPVQLLDADVEEPDAHLFLGPTWSYQEEVMVPVPRVDHQRCTRCGECAAFCGSGALAVTDREVLVFRELCHGCGGCVRVCPEQAITEENRRVGLVRTGKTGSLLFAEGRLEPGQPFAAPVVRAVRRQARRDRVVIIDAAPGTSCPVVGAVRGSDLCLLVTEPTPFGLSDLRLAVELARGLEVPSAVVLNRSDVGDGEVESWCRQRDLAILLRIPFDRALAEAHARGIPAGRLPRWRGEFAALGEEVLRRARRGRS